MPLCADISVVATSKLRISPGCVRFELFFVAQKKHDGAPDEYSQNRRSVELSVQEQCLNVLKTVEAQCAHHARNLQVHGWAFDMGRGRLMDLGIDVDGSLARISKVAHIA